MPHIAGTWISYAAPDSYFSTTVHHDVLKVALLLPLMWEMQMEFLAPSVGLTLSWLWQAIRGVNQQVEAFSLYLTAFQI